MLWVLDLDGVRLAGRQSIPGSPEAVRRLHDAGERMVFVTNNSGPTRSEYVARLGRAGIEVDADELLTSSQAAASLLEPGSRAAVVGDPGIIEALDGRGVAVVGSRENPDAVVVGRSVQLDFAELAAAATAIRDGARFMATNNDATFPTPHGLEPGAGAVVAYLEVGSGRKAEVAGKPNQAAADLLRARFGPAGLVVGDRPGYRRPIRRADRGTVRAGAVRRDPARGPAGFADSGPGRADLAAVVSARLG